MPDTYLHIGQWSQSYHEEGALSVYADIEVMDVEKDEVKKIGYVSAWVFDRIWNDNIVDAADSVSGDNHTIMAELVRLEEKEFEEFLRVGVIGYFFIEKEFRGNGVGTEALKEIYWYLQNVLRTDVICLTAKPLEKNEEGQTAPVKDKLKEKRLMKWYESMGFKQIKKTKHLFIDSRMVQPVMDKEKF